MDENTPQPAFNITKEELERAINNDEFVLYYQPKIEIVTNKIVGVEALCRWDHPKHGLIFPDQFISLLESLALIDEFSLLIVKKGLNEFEQIHLKMGMSLHISLNLSPYSLQDLMYPDKLLSIIQQTTTLPDNVILEVTEGGLLKELSNALDIFARLKINKINLSIDDFGTGYAMKQQLKNIPAAEIKIDKSLIRDLVTEDSARMAIQKIIEEGHELNMKVIAEGVENNEQLQFLRASHCDLAQGYFFSKPLPMRELLGWMEGFAAVML